MKQCEKCGCLVCICGAAGDGEIGRAHHKEYARGINDAVLWLLSNSGDYKPEALAKMMLYELG